MILLFPNGLDVEQPRCLDYTMRLWGDSTFVRHSTFVWVTLRAGLYMRPGVIWYREK